MPKQSRGGDDTIQPHPRDALLFLGQKVGALRGFLPPLISLEEATGRVDAKSPLLGGKIFTVQNLVLIQQYGDIFVGHQKANMCRQKSLPSTDQGDWLPLFSPHWKQGVCFQIATLPGRCLSSRALNGDVHWPGKAGCHLDTPAGESLFEWETVESARKAGIDFTWA